MSDNINRQYLLAARPDGLLKETDFAYHESPIPEPGDGQVLVRILMVAVEPALRGTMVEDKANPANLQIGDVMGALAAGQVVKSNSPDVAVGDLVQGLFGFADYFVTHPKAFLFSKVPDGVPLEAALYVFDTSGLTAYLGMMEIGQPSAGEHVLVSAAAGAVGSLAVQMARMAGAKVVGIAGSADKCLWLTERLGADGAINYKTEKVSTQISALLPGGIDIYFDNVGGQILDAALGQIRLGSRVILCGRISEYANSGAAYEPENSANLVNNCLRMERLVLFDHAARFPEWREIMGRWIAEGELRYQIDMLEGFENLPHGLIRLFTGENTGKQLIRLANPGL
ncbi:MAG: NADP-dependent oxidoreductase [Gammaproteobacteria bacterium]|nr:NADP-dependent oxidoreductase [Gammaproteobacteria bacterium]